MNSQPTGVAIIGCGNIAGPYARAIATYPEINFVGCADIDPARAAALAGEHGVRAYPSIEAVLHDLMVEVIVNLTVHHAHRDVITQCLSAGKHVYSEKPLALSTADAQALVQLAGEKGLRLGCSPFTFLGEAQQTAWKMLREHKLGPVRLAYAEVNWGRIEAWHPAPGPFYEVGALFDVGVYPLTLLTTFFGPARRVSAYGTLLFADRVTKEGVPFTISTPDFVTAAIELANGTVVRLTTDFYVSQKTKQRGIEFHGDSGSLFLSDWMNFNGTVEYAAFGSAYEPVPLLREPFAGVEWGRGVRGLVQAIQQDRPHLATGEQAAHIVEILCATTESYQTGRSVAITSDFTPPTPAEWAL